MADVVVVQAAMESGFRMLSVATDDFWAQIWDMAERLEFGSYLSSFRVELALSASQRASRPSILPS